MPVVQDLLSIFEYDIMEDGGLVLGLFTSQQFVDFCNESLTDLMTEVCLTQRLWTQSVFSGQGTYQYPDDIMRVDALYLCGRWIPKATQRELNNQLRNWRRTPGPPRFWYEDGLPLKTIGLAPAPDYNSLSVVGPNFPDPPDGNYDTFSPLVSTPFGNVVLPPDQTRTLTIIGPNKNVNPLTDTTDPIPLLPQDVTMGYLLFGVLQRIFSSDSELHDDQKAKFCEAQVQEGINLCKEITGEVEVT